MLEVEPLISAETATKSSLAPLQKHSLGGCTIQYAELPLAPSAKAYIILLRYRPTVFNDEKCHHISLSVWLGGAIRMVLD